MKVSESFSSAIDALIIHAVVILIFCGCATSPKSRETKSAPGFNAEAQLPWSPNKTVATIKRDPSNPDGSDQKIFEFYCQSGKQVHSLVIRGHAFVGRDKSGIALDQAERERNTKRQSAESYLRRLFEYNESSPHYSSWQSHPEIYAMTSLKSEKDTIEYGRSQSVPCQAMPSGQERQLRKNFCQTFLIDFGEADTLLLYAGVLPFSVVSWADPENPTPVRESMYYASSLHREFPESFSIINVKASFDTLHPIQTLTFIEPKTFGNEFALI
jgi:hypothetical protein